MTLRAKSNGRKLASIGTLVIATFAIVLAFAMPANAEFGFDTFEVTSLARDGSRETRAGAHPFDGRVFFSFRTVADNPNDPGGLFPEGNVKDVEVEMPAGFIGDPSAQPTCRRDQLVALNCPVESQVGVITIVGQQTGYPSPSAMPVFNMQTRKGDVADFAFSFFAVPTHIVVRVSGKNAYRVTARISNIPQAVPIASSKLTLWGVPQDRAHDGLRGSQFNCPLDHENPLCADPMFQPITLGGFQSAAPARPFLSNPTSCVEEPQTTIRANTWENPNSWATASYTDTKPTNCENLTFDGSISADFDSKRADSATGLSFTLRIPQADVVGGLATPTLKKAAVTLPEGVSINPSVANGLQGCTDPQIDLSGANGITCPDASKIGDVTIKTPLLNEPLSGMVYLGQPVPGKRYRIFFAANNADYGVSIRLEGVLTPDPVTGRLTTVFDNNPQMPFSELTLRFFGGPNAPLATSQTGGSGTTTAVLTPWAGVDAPSVTATSTSTTDANPAPGFAPSFRAAGSSVSAGGDTAFSLTFGRNDGERYLNDINVALPKGLLARIGSVPLCADGPAAAGACDASSQIGSTTVGSGAGSAFFLGGKVYMTGPYKGAPFGFSIVVPAIAGPFDLGTVVVRAAVFIDRNTTAIRVVSDPLPTILEGVPLRMRTVNVRIDRSRFMINPTNCSAASVAAVIGSIAGAAANASSRFQVANCSALPFKPKMTLKVGAKGKLTSGKRTPLEVTLAMTPGQANNRSVQVTLPLSLNARLDVVNKRRACTIEQFRADRCPMTVGEATAVTPLLRDPLKGPAYFVYNPDRRLPDLVVRLKGQVDVDLVGKVTIAKDLRLVTTFDTVPDVPITKFRLALASGGTNGPIGIVRNLCSATTRKGLKANLAYLAQNGRRLSVSQQISVAGCGKAKTKRAAKKK